MGDLTTPSGAFGAVWRRLPATLQRRLFRAVLSNAADTERFRAGAPTMAGLLENARANGFVPGAIIDIGANVGDWTRMARSVFPHAPIAMFDGNPLHEMRLAAATKDVGHASYTMAVLGPEPKDNIVFYSIGAGSGVLPELTSFPRDEQHLKMSRLDDLIGDTVIGRPTPARLLIKLDVQGFELEVLRGGRATLAQAELLMLETSLLPYNEGGASFGDVVAFMMDEGFVAFDFCGQFRRQTDWTLCQTDVAFVRKDSDLRRPKKFWANEP